ncbi:hypothetical protein CONCODRAFT_73069 [Conidiobolus coronatus NRRL 28638]|uniref:Ricin B lectin domain-containing protein n=1 Tax=Conidiobolus coronatus (strain ATCC 28846 / CBS 209.66 / NRRL 28638) TaxID=796925 RepID=A0A137NX30_CONC2|nr:hypothetical protein CONCODRAFT_73069 [Conidiobolus coronatus NRRL 28638]|eukprot:KXN67302.1 hypothetical protein CONCODRAFT_73069 [Conidiobolus coronatus NRRL 28638]
MFFIQIKSLAYFIFAITVVCQIESGNYTIVNRQVESYVLASSPPGSDGVHVIVKLPEQVPDPLEQWNVSLETDSQGLIQNAETQQFLLIEGNQAILTDSQAPCFIIIQDDGSITISYNISGPYLSLDTSSDPYTAVTTSAVEDSSKWNFISVS